MTPGLRDATHPIAWVAGASHADLRVLTAADLWTQAASLSRRLAQSKVQTWVLASRNPWQVLVACLAAWSVPERQLHIALPPNLLPATLLSLVSRLQLENGPAEILRYRQADSFAAGGEIAQPASVDRAAVTWAAGAIEQLSATRGSNRHCLTLFTSGTTGEQHACGKRLEQLWLEAELQATLFFPPPNNMAGDRRVLCCVPPHHIFGLLFGVWVPFCAGVSFVAADTDSTISAALCHGASDLVSVPAQLGAWLGSWATQATAPLPTRVFSSGAPLPHALGVELMARGLQLVELFGSTETGGIAQRVDDPGGTWRPLPGVQISEGPEQRLLLQSPLQGTSAPVLTADRITTTTGGFVHLGRSDDVVKVGAKRVALSDLERFVLALPEIDDAAAIAMPNPGLRENMLWLAVASKQSLGRPATEQRLREALREHFDGVIVPRRIRVVAQLPRNALGKLPREALLALFDGASDSISSGTQHAKETTDGL